MYYKYTFVKALNAPKSKSTKLICFINLLYISLKLTQFLTAGQNFTYVTEKVVLKAKKHKLQTLFPFFF